MKKQCQKNARNDGPKQTWQKNAKPNAEKMTKKTTINIQQPSEFAGKIFIMLISCCFLILFASASSKHLQTFRHTTLCKRVMAWNSSGSDEPSSTRLLFLKTRLCMSSHRREAHFQVKMSKTRFGPLLKLLKVQTWFRVAGAGACAPCQKWAQSAAFPQTMAMLGLVNRIGKKAFHMVQKKRDTYTDVFGDQGGDFLWAVAFGAWDLQVGRDDFAWLFVASVLLWDMDRKKRKRHWYEAVSCALIFPALNDL